MTMVILFLRSLLFYAGYLLFTILLSLVFLICVLFIPESSYHHFSMFWCRLILFWLRLCCGVTYRVTGLENIPHRPVVVLANHQSEWETIFLYRYLAPICPILKKELLSIPFYGWALRIFKPIAIDRSKPGEAGKSILRQGTARIRDGHSVIIFPEGTRTDIKQSKKFSRGGAKLAIAAGVPILPIAHNAGHFWPPHRFIKRPGTISVFVGALLDDHNKDASILTDKAERWIREHVVIPAPPSLGRKNDN
jgi:1-acyl-sn-glycerol-3-phosphate acyltransferase